MAPFADILPSFHVAVPRLRTDSFILISIMTKRKKTFLTLSAVFILIAGLGAWAIFRPISSIDRPSYVYIDADDTSDSLIAHLRAESSPIQLAGFRLLSAVLLPDHPRPGRYAIGPEVSPLSLVRAIRGGIQVPVRLTVPVVRTVNDLARRLSATLATDSATLVHALTDSATCSRYGYTPQTILCLFIPNTYEVRWTITPDEFLRRMERESRAFWTPKRQEQARAVGLTPVEVITLASIVDQETANNAEKPEVAAMYLNRLRIGMKLQADPTVKFALADFSLRRILHEHLTYPSPYNTYLHAGLPPGPIALPAVSSIEAVLSPAHHDYLYMCAREDFSGTHRFAATYAEHLVNARRYAEALNRRGIK